MANRNTKIYSTAIIAIIYLLAFLTVYYNYSLLTFSRTMINVLIADIAATAVIFVFSIIFNNSSVYDPYWSVAPPVIAIYLMNLFPEGNHFRQLLIAALVLCWSIRLTVNWFRGWQGISHQDWRYTSISEKTGKWYWPVSFIGIHFMPTIFVFLGCLPLWYSMSDTSPMGIPDLVAAVFTLTAIVLEWIADEQLLRFRKSNGEKAFIRSGIWNYSRHPNYFGEISFWGGMFLFVISSTGLRSFTGYWTVIGLVSMIILFKFISIPIMEKRNRIRKPGYDKYIDEVPALLPHLYGSTKLKAVKNEE
jgi:steroid 5-alpha reductase family enzyme